MNLIVAIAHNNVMGKDNRLPWHLPEDLKNFKEITMGNVVIMGRKTYESLPNGALPFRKNIVLTRDENLLLEDAEVMNTVEEVLAFQELHPEEELFVIGGAEIYKALMPHVHKIYLTFVDAYVEGDTFFELEESEFQLVYRTETMKGKSGLKYSFSELTRIGVTS